MSRLSTLAFFFFNDTATTEIYTLSLHDALPISEHIRARTSDEKEQPLVVDWGAAVEADQRVVHVTRSEEHTSELQSRQYLVCRLLLEKKKNTDNIMQLTLHSTKKTLSDYSRHIT